MFRNTVAAFFSVMLLVAATASAEKTRQNAAARCITAQADAVFEALRPLTKSCSRVGPASAQWKMDAGIWNGFSHDEQQQLMDEVASKEAIQSARVTIHLYVYSTEVGTIGPGWGGEWKFRRKKN